MAKQGSQAGNGPAESDTDPVIETRGDAAAATAAQAGAAGVTGAEAQPGLIPPVPVEVPGPGAGALNVATEAAGYATRPLDAESRDATGQFLAAAAPAHPLAGVSPTTAAFVRQGSVLDTARSVFDAAEVQGERIVEAATNILRNGTMHRSGDRFPVGFKEYTELVQIGAIVARAWRHLEDPED